MRNAALVAKVATMLDLLPEFANRVYSKGFSRLNMKRYAPWVDDFNYMPDFPKGGEYLDVG